MDGGPRPRLQATLTQKLMDYWFLAGHQPGARKTPLPIKTERFAGKYLDNVYCHTCFEGDEGVWSISGVTTVKAAGEGVLEKARPPRTAFWLGAAFGLKGDKERAFEWLNRAVELGFDKRRLNTEPVLNGLRDDRAFKACPKQSANKHFCKNNPACSA